MTKNTVMVLTRGPMGKFTQDNGWKENNMVKQSSQIPKEKVKLVSGKMERERNGFNLMKLINKLEILLPNREMIQFYQ